MARTGALPLRKAKNGTTSGDVHENTSDDDKMSYLNGGFLQENAPIACSMTIIHRTF
jgi:hypothetical protein